MERLRVRFSRGEELKFISHLDMMKLWERVIRRAGLAIAYSEGFTPHPKISLAAPLPVGVTSNAELMDLFLTGWLSPDIFRVRIAQQLPKGIEILETMPIALTAASLQALIRFAEYDVILDKDEKIPDINSSIKSMINLKEIPWQHTRDKEIRSYNLRPLINDLWLVKQDASQYMMGMRLRCDTKGTGRPEQVIKAMGFTKRPVTIHRTKLILN